MNISDTDIADIKILSPNVFNDERGYFFESFNDRVFSSLTGFEQNFVQDNHSRSSKNVLRGLHYQINNPQAKLVRVIKGEIFDVAVDLRQKSSTFSQWTGVRLSSENHFQLWLPEGFAHGFYVLSDHAEVLYKTSDYYSASDERCIIWDDPDIGINWPFPKETTPTLSAKDAEGIPFNQAEYFK